MKSKKIICGAVVAAIVLGATFSGCSLVSTINEEDMKQTVATVDLSKSDVLKDDGLSDYAQYVGETTIIKRDLVASFVNVGYTYVSSYGYTYEETFELLMSSLTSSAVVTQYATMYMLKYKVDAGTVTLADYNAKETEEEKYVYLLGGEDSDGVLKAQYSLYSSINTSLDSFETSKIDEDDTYTGTDTRTTPTNVDTEKEDYLPTKEFGGKRVLDYGVYTGYGDNILDNAGTYEELDGTNKNTRRRAYSDFISSLKNNYLLIPSNEEDITDVLSLSYIQDEYVSQLQSQVVEEFYDLYEDEQEKKLNETDGNSEYVFVKNKYNELLEDQTIVNADSDSFETAMGNMSDTSFVLYAPDTTRDTEEQNGTYGTFGYVYNILLPFSAAQSDALEILDTDLEADKLTDNEYYAKRNALLKDITTTDQRSAWFNGETDYSFDASETSLSYYNGGNSDRKYLFFENNLTKTKQYETLEKYFGKYSYNGKVKENKDGSYTLIPNKLTIDDMLSEFSAYINYVLVTTDSVEIYNGESTTEYSSTNAGYYTVSDFMKSPDSKEVNYSKFVYVTGKVKLGSTSVKDLLTISTNSYKVISAVNELQYAYTTDTGVLSEYIGYSVSAYDTSYIGEFEYAAQQAIRAGAGTFKVCAGQYGWHLIYVTDAFSFNGGEVYSGLTWTAEKVKEEGTFENKFYEWIKDEMLSSASSDRRAQIIDKYSNDTTVTVYEDAYEDLSGLDS